MYRDTMHGSLDTCWYRRGVSEPVGAVTLAGSCCFRLDELIRIVLRLGKCVKCYLTPLAIGVVFLPGFYLTPLAIVTGGFKRFVKHLRSLALHRLCAGFPIPEQP
jgi:hypothetical protein